MSATRPVALGGLLTDTIACTAIAALSAIAVYFLLGAPPLIGMDDANITEVYGRNVAAGWGFVYTRGHEMVEGSTSLLWTLLYAAAYALPGQPERWMLGAAFLCSTGAILLQARLARLLGVCRGGTGRRERLAALGVFIGVPSFFAWTVLSLMDSAPWALILSALVATTGFGLAGRLGKIFPALLALLSALAVPTRPEALALVPAILALGAAATLLLHGARAALMRVAPAVAAFGLAAVALTLFRLRYFGYPLPNTFYAKVSTSTLDNIRHGAAYIVHFLFADLTTLLGILLTCAATAAAFLLIRRRTEPGRSTAAAIAALAGGTLLAGFAAQLLEGGDHFGAFRMLIPYLPLLAAPLAYGLAAFDRLPEASDGRRVELVAACGLILLIAGHRYLVFEATNQLRVEFDVAAQGRALGHALNRLPGPPPSIGVDAAGGIALTYQGRVLDELGLNWPAMAHASGRRAGLSGHAAFSLTQFWSEPPDIMNPLWVTDPDPTAIRTVSPWYETEFLGLFADTRFRQAYTPALLHEPEGVALGYFRSDYIAKLADKSSITLIDWDRIRAR